MTIQPVAPPHLLTVAEYLEIGEIELACHLAGEFGYAEGGLATGRFTAVEPFPVELDLDALL